MGASVSDGRLEQRAEEPANQYEQLHYARSVRMQVLFTDLRRFHKRANLPPFIVPYFRWQSSSLVNYQKRQSDNKLTIFKGKEIKPDILL
jgi:hypothetical protein